MVEFGNQRPAILVFVVSLVERWLSVRDSPGMYGAIGDVAQAPAHRKLLFVCVHVFLRTQV